MKLLDIYKNKNLDTAWFDDHSSLAKGKHGRMFEYVNTNFRNQKSFAEHFLTFQEIESVPREEWPRQESHGQEKHKHIVVNMIHSKLFKLDSSGLYKKTAKGQLYGDFIKSEIPDNEKWLINYLFLINGYYFSRKNYILNRVREDLLGYLLSVDGFSEDFLIKSTKKILKQESLADILRSDFFYIHSFYDDSDFLINYIRSSIEEKEELADYIEHNLSSGNYECCISKKYQSGGNFNKAMLFDETKVFLMTLSFARIKDADLSNSYNIFVDSYNSNVAAIDKALVRNYINQNSNIFEPIFSEILEVEGVEGDMSDSIISEDIAAAIDVPEEYIDETEGKGKQKIKTLFDLRKKQARIQSDYKCALEVINNCKSIYFNAKTNNKNYVELHHLIPREFRNDFPYSIEVLANYVTLCPRCHRQIHLAKDTERKHLINVLLNERESRLENVGLRVDLEKIYEYYKIQD